jgi:CheY-like chemotaxis protein
VSHDTPEAVVGDVTRLRQILLNLLSGALKFTEQGEVVLSVDSRPLDDAGYELHFAVRDTGIGISPDRIHRLFQSFSQLDPSTTRKYGGTGLGLAISKRLAELMGASMEVTSEVSVGTTFRFTAVVEVAARAVRTPVAPAPAAAAPATPLHGMRVLLAEDNAVNQKLALRLLERMGLRADVVGNGREVLDALSRQRYDVVLMDVQMPELDGVEATRHIRERQPGQDGPWIIAMTANAMQGDREAYLAAG